MSDILVLVVLLPLLSGLAALGCRDRRGLVWTMTLGGVLGVAAAAAAALGPSGAGVFGGALHLDALSRVLLLVVGGVGALSTVDSFVHWRGELALGGPHLIQVGRGLPRVRTYFFWQQAFLACLLLAAASGNLGVSWVAIELTTVTSAVLVGLGGGARAVEAAWKYVVLCSVGLALALVTVLVLYALGGGGGLPALNWSALEAAAAHFPPGPAKLAYLFALVGLGTKAGLAPVHTWLPDAHSEAPAPISGLLSGVLLATVLCTLARVASITAQVTGAAFPYHLLLGAGLLSVAVATPFLMLQEDLKRLLAYSSLEQVGLMAVGFGLHVPLAAVGAVLQLVVHALTKSGLFFTAGQVVHDAGTQRLARLRGVGRHAPLLGAGLLIGIFTLGGLPPFGLFFSELDILRAALATSPWIGLGLFGLLAAIFGGLVYYVGNAVLGPGRPFVPTRAGATTWAVVGLPVLLALVVGLWTPHALSGGLQAAASVVLGGRQ